MGWYVKCEMCGRENKYVMGCECYLLASKKVAEEMQGCVILASHFVVDSWTFYDLYQELQKPNKEFLYVKISLQDGGGEYKEHRKIAKLTEEEFYSRINRAAKPTIEDWSEIEAQAKK